LFNEKLQNPPLEGVRECSVAFADVDGDDDQDLLITGEDSSSTRFAKLYSNDGNGNFVEMQNTPFEGVAWSSIAFVDVDGDQHQDVIITGSSGGLGGQTSRLYINDGLGNFTGITNTPFENVSASSVAFADVDGDSDQDLLITGAAVGANVSKLYKNDGSGNFTEVTGTPFTGVFSGSIAFADVDGDSDQDVLITGRANDGQVSTLYINDGFGVFTEMIDSTLVGVGYSSIAFSDIDGDFDQDVLITGSTDSARTSKLYINDGAGNYAEMIDLPFEGVNRGSVAFADVDGDHDHDVLITGQGSSGYRVSKLYVNDGLGNFREIAQNPFESAALSSIAFADVDGDTDQDVLICGWSSFNGLNSKLYINEDVSSADYFKVSKFKFDLLAFPNPTNTSQLKISYKSLANGFVSLSVFDLKGDMLSQQKEFAVIGQQNFSIDTASMPSGTYIVQLDNAVGIGTTRIVVK